MEELTCVIADKAVGVLGVSLTRELGDNADQTLTSTHVGGPIREKR
jgi:hypothetical protein